MAAIASSPITFGDDIRFLIDHFHTIAVRTALVAIDNHPKFGGKFKAPAVFLAKRAVLSDNTSKRCALSSDL